jgi:hypothetical protein
MAPEVAKQTAARDAAITKAREAAKKQADESMPRQTQWENYMDLSTEWIPLDVEVVRATGVAKLEKQPDGSLFATPLPDGQMALGNYQLKSNTTLNGITGIKLEVLPDERLPGNGPGLATDGNFVLSEFLVSQSPLNAKRAKGGKAGAIAISKAFADFEQKSFAVTEAFECLIVIWLPLALGPRASSCHCSSRRGTRSITQRLPRGSPSPSRSGVPA